MNANDNHTSNLLRFVDAFSEFDETEALTPTLAKFAENGFDETNNGNLPRWLKAVSELPEPDSRTNIVLNASTPSVSYADSQFQHPADFQENFEQTLRKLHPWRKGPFELFDIHIDAEWRSNVKWDRLRSGIFPLKGRLVLDVGCGNGYYGLRMVGEGAGMVVGVDHGLSAVMQFQALNKYFKTANLAVFPGSVDLLPEPIELFDTVFSMGLLYHQRKPLRHLERLRSFLKPGGECVLESIVIDGGKKDCLVPPGRYARMRNVYFFPSVKLLKKWLKSSGFCKIKLIDMSPTTTDEQRSTPWMTYKSLSDFLDPNDPSKTVEGHPAPKRAVLSAQK